MAHTQWEYLAVALDYAGGYKRPRYVNHEELPGWHDAPLAIEYFNHLGRDSWELIATPNATSDEYLFKRPVRAAVTAKVSA